MAWTLGSAEEEMYSGTISEVQPRGFANGLDTGYGRKTAVKDSKGFQKLEVGPWSRYGRSWESGFALTKCKLLLRRPVVMW